MDKMTIFGLPNILVIACHVHFVSIVVVSLTSA